MRMDRRAGLLSAAPLLSLLELWSAATILQNVGYAGSSVTTRTITIEDGASAPFWVFASTGTGCSFSKVKNNAGNYLNTALLDANGIPADITVEASGNTGTKITSGSSYYNELVAFRFAGISEKQVDATLKAMALTVMAGRNESSIDTIRVPTSSLGTTQNYFYLQCGAPNSGASYFSMCSGDAWDTPVLSHNGSSTRTQVYWRSSSSYRYLSISTSSNTTWRGGSICQLFL